MSEPVANGAAENNGPTFAVEKIYVKDVSFEAPGAPQVFTEQGQPNLEMNLNQRVQRVADNLFEVELGVTLSCKLAEKTIYLVEIQQAGVFLISGIEGEELKQILASYCPSLLYPYAREAVSDLVSKGGFPQLLLQPVNFDRLYQQARESEAAKAPTEGNA
mgnify:CR=1 FL=1